MTKEQQDIDLWKLRIQSRMSQSYQMQVMMKPIAGPAEDSHYFRV